MRACAIWSELNSITEQFQPKPSVLFEAFVIQFSAASRNNEELQQFKKFSIDRAYG